MRNAFNVNGSNFKNCYYGALTFISLLSNVINFFRYNSEIPVEDVRLTIHQDKHKKQLFGSPRSFVFMVCKAELKVSDLPCLSLATRTQWLDFERNYPTKLSLRVQSKKCFALLWKQSICNYLETSPIACNLTHKGDLLGDSGPSWIYPTNCVTEKERNQSLQQIWLVAFKVAHQTHRKLHPHRVALCCLQLYTKFGAGLSQRRNDFEPRVRGRHYLFVFQTSLFFVFFFFFFSANAIKCCVPQSLKMPAWNKTNIWKKQHHHNLRGPDNQGGVYEGHSNANVPTMYAPSARTRTHNYTTETF